MTLEELKKVIVDQKQDVSLFFQEKKIIQRQLNEEKLRVFLKQPNILVISGPRRCGKSVLSTMLLKNKKYGYINFDDERLVGFTRENFNALLQAFYEIHGNDLEYFIFDEIQNIDHWQLFINRLRKNKKIIVTGSNAKLLSGELATYLTGRHINFSLYPFSFKEFLDYRSFVLKEHDMFSTKQTAELRRYLKDYIRNGGFPEALVFGSAYVKNIYGDILSKDILMRHNIKNKNTFKESARYLLSNFAHRISYSKLKNIFGLKNVQTVKNYVDYLAESFVLFEVEKFSFKLKQQLISPRKVYGIDTGLINALTFQFSENYGRLMENCVYLELLRKKSYYNNDLEIYYWQNNSDKEVDFVIKKGKKIKQLIQVCRNIDDYAIKERELKSLLIASKDLKCDDLLIITDELKERQLMEGKTIKFMPLYEWLLELNV